jgi:hypothetical protein
MMRVARYVLVTLWFRFLESLKVSWRDEERYFGTGDAME